MEEKYYIELPHQLFYKLEDKISIFKSIQVKSNKKDNDKPIYRNSYYTILVLDYLYTNTNRQGYTIFTIEDITKFCDLSKKGYYIVKDILIGLEQLKILNNIKFDIKNKDAKDIKINTDLKDLKPITMIHSKMNLFTLNDKGKNKWFSILYYDIKNTILSYDVEKVDNVALLFYYCYLNARIRKRSNEQGDLAKSGGMPEVCYPSYETIYDDLGFTDDTITKYNNILKDLKLIVIGNAGIYYYSHDKNKITRESNNIYAIVINGNVSNANDNIKEEIKIWKSLEINKDKIWTNSKEYKNNNRKLNGEKSYIIKKEKLGIATPEDIKHKLEIIESQSENIEHIYKIKNLFDKNKDICLSNIYNDLGKPKKAKYYADLEIKLGLVDDNDFLVDWEYYKWVMVSYTKDKHDYYVNCIAKYKREQQEKAKPIKHLGNTKHDNKIDSDEEQEIIHIMYSDEELADIQKQQQYDDWCNDKPEDYSDCNDYNNYNNYNN